MGKRSFALVTVALMGFASGLPLYLTGSTMAGWLTDAGISLQAIGAFGLVTLPYALKFLWAPLLDRYMPPFLGRRRGWMAIWQAVLVVLLCLLAWSDPRAGLTRFATLAFLVAFASASQDIAIDAWRREAFAEKDLGLANAVCVGAYRVAMLVSGAGGLILAQKLGWREAYLVMAALMALAAAGTFLAWSTDASLTPPRTLLEAVERPLMHLVRRKGILEVMAFCLLYKVGDQLANAMTVPFLMRGMGFTKLQIGGITKTVGLTAAIVGGILGGLVMRKVRLRRALVAFGLLQGASILGFWALSRLGPNLGLLAGALALENLAFAMGTTAYTTFIMLLCDRRFTGTQYALLTSLFGFSRGLLATPGGWVAARAGWSAYFLGCALVAIPGLLLLLRFDAWGIDEDNGAEAV